MIITNEFENIYWPINTLVLGIDEVGRGPLCGPLVVCGAILPIGYKNDKVIDSKKLSEKRIDIVYNELIKDCIWYHIEIVSAKVIDELNIYQATKTAMEKIANIAPKSMILTDAMPLDINNKYEKLIKGDQRSINIAAASIIAKYTRDHIMLEYDALYPEYGYKDHKGYPTKKHLDAIKEYGLKDFYRISYRPCKEIIEISLF